MVYMPGGSGPTRPSFCSQWQDRSSAWVTSGGSRTSATRTEEVKHVTAEVIVFLSLSFTALVLFGLSCFSFVGVWLWAPFWCALCVECKVSYPGVWKLVLSVDCVGSVPSFKCNMFNPQGSVWGCNIGQSHCQCQKCAVILFLIIFVFEQKKTRKWSGKNVSSCVPCIQLRQQCNICQEDGWIASKLHCLWQQNPVPAHVLSTR